jgi:hypothetical protein
MATRTLPLHAVGRPAPWPVVATSLTAALGGWQAAACALVPAAPDVAVGRLAGAGPVLAVHLAALAFLPLAVAGAAWHVLPVMLRNDLPGGQRRFLALGLLAAGVPLAFGVAYERPAVVWVCLPLLAVGACLVAADVAALVVRAPAGRMLVASRAGVVLSALHALAALALGAAVFEAEGPTVFGAPFERMLLVHLLLGGLGWLTVLILSVGRTLAPMLAMAPAAPRRRLPALEIAFTAALWLLLGALATGNRPLAAAGLACALAALGRFGAQLAGVARRRRIDAVEGPLAHFLVGAVCLAQAAAAAFAALAGVVDERRGAAAAAILVVIGWGAGVTLGHLGKLLSLSAWTAWPPGPRPKQGALYPRLLWMLEAVAFAVGVELLAAGALTGTLTAARAGAAVLVAAALLALSGAAGTLRAVAQRRSIASAAR